MAMAKAANYAQKTTVTVAKSKHDIEAVITRFGATSFLSGYDGNRVFVAFRFKERNVKFTMTTPLPGGTHRFSTAASREAEERRLWRCLYLLIKAKLTAVQDGIVVFDQEFYAHVLTATGETIYERTKDQLALEYKENKVQPLMIGGPR